MASSASLFPSSSLPLDSRLPLLTSHSSLLPLCFARVDPSDASHGLAARTSLCLHGSFKVSGASLCHAIAFDSSGVLQIDVSRSGELDEFDIATNQEDVLWPEDDYEGEVSDFREAWQLETSIMKSKDHWLQVRNSKSSVYSDAIHGESRAGDRAESALPKDLFNMKGADIIWRGTDQMPVAGESEGKKTGRSRITNGRSLKSLEINEKQSESVSARQDEEPSGDEATEPISKIPVPRQKYISVSKVLLVKTLAEAFNNDSKASEFLFICSFLDRILHAEHKAILELMRLDYKRMRSALKKEEAHTSRGFSRKRKGRKRNTWIETIRAVLAFLNKRRGRKGADKASSNGREQIAGASSERSSNGPLPKLTNDMRGEARVAMESQVAKSSSSGLINTTASHSDIARGSSNGAIRNNIPAAARFQRNFLRLLRNAQFQGLSARDLQLTSALNSDYFLTLPIDVDWKQVSSENAIIFRRGYAAERQDGLLFGAKLDYIQSLVLRQMFSSFSGPLFGAGSWILQKWKQLRENEESKTWTEGFREWLREPLKPDMEDDLPDVLTEAFTDQEKEGDLPFWIAARQAVPRYEAFLSSVGSRGMLLRRILVWMRLLPVQAANPKAKFPSDLSTSEPLSRGNYLTRVSMRDIWMPASKVVCGDSLWQRIRAIFSVFFSRSVLQEPAFKELVLLYNIPKNNNGDSDREEIPNLHVQIYGKIPLPDLKVVFPNKKLSFRILDTVRLDIATVIGLLAFLLNYRFDDFLSSPSAFLLDIIATSALIVYVTRAVLGYKRTWDRYQLLVNKTLYEKTLASGFGAVHFLVDASEQQQFKEVVLAVALLMLEENHQIESEELIAVKCEHFLYHHFKEQIEMPVEDALQILSRLGLIVRNKSVTNMQEDDCGAGRSIQILPHARAAEVMKHRWNELLYEESIWTSSQF